MDDKTISQLRSCSSAAAWTARSLIANHHQAEVHEMASGLATHLAILENKQDNEFTRKASKHRERLFAMSPDDLYHYCIVVIDDCTKKIKDQS